MSRQLLRIGLIVALGGTGCGDSVAPLERVTTRIEVSRVRGLVGDTVELRAVATNHGTQTLEVGVNCATGLEVEVRLPTGERRFLLRYLADLCDMKDSHVLEPGETDSYAVKWVIPGPVGTYQVRAGIATDSGIRAPSPFTRLVVN